MLDEVNLLQDMTQTTRAMVGAFVDDRTDADGVISSDTFTGLARRIGFRAQPWEAALKVRPSFCFGFCLAGHGCAAPPLRQMGRMPGPRAAAARAGDARPL